MAFNYLCLAVLALSGVTLAGVGCVLLPAIAWDIVVGAE